MSQVKPEHFKKRYADVLKGDDPVAGAQSVDG